MRLEAPNDVDVLCVALDIGLKRRARLSDEMGEKFIPWLQEQWVWAREQDASRLLRQTLPGGGSGRARAKADGIVRGSPRSGARRVVDDRPRRNRRRRVVKPPSAAEVLDAAEASSYTSNPYLAIEGEEQPHDPVPAAYQNLLSMQGRARHAEERQQNPKEEHVDENARQVARQIRDVAVAIHRSGGDSVAFLADIQRQVGTKRNELRNAA